MLETKPEEKIISEAVETPEASPVLDFWGRSINSERWRAIVSRCAPGERILDLGAGRGAYTERLCEIGYSATGIDIHPYSEWTAKPRGRFLAADGSALPFEAKAFDTTIAFEVLEHCPDARAVLAEIRRCTVKRLILSVPNCDLENALHRHDLALAHWTDRTHCNFFTRTSISDLLRETGWKIDEITNCYKVSPNDYFWDTIRLPRPLPRIFKRLCEKLNLTETYWSSILVVATIKDREQ